MVINQHQETVNDIFEVVPYPVILCVLYHSHGCDDHHHLPLIHWAGGSGV